MKFNKEQKKYLIDCIDSKIIWLTSKMGSEKDNNTSKSNSILDNATQKLMTIKKELESTKMSTPYIENLIKKSKEFTLKRQNNYV